MALVLASALAASVFAAGQAQAVRCQRNCAPAPAPVAVAPVAPAPLVLVPADASFQSGFAIGAASLQSYGSTAKAMAAPFGWIEAYRALTDAGVKANLYSRAVLWDCRDADCEYHLSYGFINHGFADLNGHQYQPLSEQGMVAGFGIRIVMNDSEGREIRVALIGAQMPIGRAMRGPDGTATVLVLSRQPDPYPLKPLSLAVPSGSVAVGTIDSHSPERSFLFTAGAGKPSPQAWFDFYRQLFTSGLGNKTYRSVTLIVESDPAAADKQQNHRTFLFYDMEPDGRLLDRDGHEYSPPPAAADGALPGGLVEFDVQKADRTDYIARLFGSDYASRHDGIPTLFGSTLAMVITQTQPQGSSRGSASTSSTTGAGWLGSLGL